MSIVQIPDKQRCVVRKKWAKFLNVSRENRQITKCFGTRKWKFFIPPTIGWINYYNMTLQEQRKNMREVEYITFDAHHVFRSILARPADLSTFASANIYMTTDICAKSQSLPNTCYMKEMISAPWKT